MGTVSVRGLGSVAAAPDEAVVTVELAAIKKTRDDAYADVASRTQALDTLCAELEIEPARRTTSGVSVGEYYEWDGKKQQLKGFRAATSQVFRLPDPAVVAKLLEQAVVRVDARVDGPWWRIRTDNPAHLEARRRAARDARAKAEALAEAVGARLGPIDRIAEPGSEGPVMPAVRAAPMMAQDAAAGGAAPIQLEPGEQFVEAAVEITFALEQ
jgi:uncharacterized protein YggE